MKEVGALPNPDPTDTGPWNKEQVKTADIHIDEKLEQDKPGMKLEAQKWAGLTEDPKADLFVFVGRWSQQKGVDSIADVFPSVLEHNPKVQLICIGPVIDLYGRFAALKLARMMEVYPGRVFSKPEFTALPGCIFSGADFALMPSRDEPFGLVAVEFGRKGALCVGARVGGLGQMPGWWFTIESTTTKHFMHQFKTAIQGALASKPDQRAIMRARAAKQRFPVAQWVEDLEKLQNTAIEISEKQMLKSSRNSMYTPDGSRGGTPRATRRNTPTASRRATPAQSRVVSRAGSPVRGESDQVPPLRNGGMGSRIGPGYKRKRFSRKSMASAPTSEAEESSDEEGRSRRSSRPVSLLPRPPSLPPLPSLPADMGSDAGSESLVPAPVSSIHWPFAGPTPTSSAPPETTTINVIPAEDDCPPEHQTFLGDKKPVNASMLSLPGIKGDRTDYKLQNVAPFFTDPKKEFTHDFEKKLGNLNGKTSEDVLCIEEYLVKSEKQWFGKLRAAELGRNSLATTKHNSPSPSIFYSDRGARSPAPSILDDRNFAHSTAPTGATTPQSTETVDEFLLGTNYQPPTGLKHLLRQKVGDWPIYSILLAFGQIIAANSYQITLLSGSVGQTASKLYVIASIYLLASLAWWFLYRRLQTVYVLSLPFAIYGLAFLLIGLAPLGPGIAGRGWIQNVATGLYAVASASGSIYFAVNFGDEGGAPVTAWTFRACVIQGTQQIYVVALWYWGNALTKATELSASGASAASVSRNVIIPVGVLVACLMWAVGSVLFVGLPKYYRQAPGKIPSFYKSLFRRKIIIVRPLSSSFIIEYHN